MLKLRHASVIASDLNSAIESLGNIYWECSLFIGSRLSLLLLRSLLLLLLLLLWLLLLLLFLLPWLVGHSFLVSIRYGDLLYSTLRH